MSEMYLPPSTDNRLEDSLAWQKILSAAPNSFARQQMGEIACDLLNQVSGFMGSSKILVKSDIGFVLSEDTDHMKPKKHRALQFGEITAMGHLGMVECVNPLSDQAFLIWSVYDARILNTSDRFFDESQEFMELEDGRYMPVDRPMRMPLCLPVRFIDYALPVGKT